MNPRPQPVPPMLVWLTTTMLVTVALTTNAWAALGLLALPAARGRH